MHEPILIATDGRPGAIGAVRWARLLARREGRPLHVLAAHEPVAVYGGAAPTAPFRIPLEPMLEDARGDQLRDAVLEQLREVGREGCDETVVVRVGSPAPTILQYAIEIGAVRILLGLGRHSRADRWFGTETALRLVRLAHVPVLAVAADAAMLPRRAVVGIDFSEFSLNAAHNAADLLDEGGELYLVHSTWLGAGIAGWQSEPGWFTIYRSGAEAHLAKLAEELRSEHRIQIESLLVPAEATPEVLRIAEAKGAELVAVGSHGHGYFGRLILGSISTAVLRSAHCSVLIAPPRAVAAAVAAAAVQSATSAVAVAER